MEKKLKIWNGRWGGGKHVYVAAYNRADAGWLLCQAAGHQLRGIDREIKEYFSEGLWGRRMSGITPERGVWIDDEPHRSDVTPRRVV